MPALKETEIRPLNLLDEYLRLSAEDAARFFTGDENLQHRPCPGCGDDSPRAAFPKNGFDLAWCGACETLYVTPGPSLERLQDFYRDSPSQRYWADTFLPAVTESRRRKIVVPRIRRIREILTSGGFEPETVIDVGAGAGTFLEECAAAGLGNRHRAVEPNAAMAAVLSDAGFDTFEGFAEEAAAAAGWAGSAELVTSFEVIEHVTSPVDYIKNLTGLARPGGLVLVTGLCGTGFDILALGEHAKAVSPPHHLNFLSRAGVGKLLQRCALEEVAFLTPGELDVDIVCNTLAEKPEVAVDGFVRFLATTADEAVRNKFQEFLAKNHLSSHMWIVARTPV